MTSTRTRKLGILWRGDEAARRSATPETSRFKDVFAELADVGIEAVGVDLGRRLRDIAFYVVRRRDSQEQLHVGAQTLLAFRVGHIGRQELGAAGFTLAAPA